MATVRDIDGNRWRASYRGRDPRGRFVFEFSCGGAAHLVRFTPLTLASSRRRVNAVVHWSRGAIVPAEPPDSFLLWDLRVRGGADERHFS
jgi:hypothetical protein